MPSTLGEKLKELRRQKKFSLDDLAKRSGASKSYLWELENRPDRKPSAEKLIDIASEVSRLVYAVEGEVPPTDEPVLERVQDTALSSERIVEPRKPEPVGQSSAVSDRLAALRDIQSRT